MLEPPAIVSLGIVMPVVFLPFTARAAESRPVLEYRAFPDSARLALPSTETWTWTESGRARIIRRAADESVYGTPPGYVCEIVKPSAISDLGYYSHVLDARAAAAATTHGWRLTVRGRFWHPAPHLSRAVGFGVETAIGRSHVGFQTYRPGGPGTETTTIAGLYNRAAVARTGDRAFHCFYHVFELIWDPVAGKHALIIDSRTADALSGEPLPVGDGPARVAWGAFADRDAAVKAHGYFDEIRFEIAASRGTPLAAWDLVGASDDIAARTDRRPWRRSQSARPLHVNALCDFVDEASSYDYAITEAHLTSLMRLLKGAGVKTVSWAHYADDKGGPLLPASSRATKTFRGLGNAFAGAVRAGHAEGLEVFGYFKPYEMAVDMVFPAGSPEAQKDGLFDRIGGKIAWADPFVAANPHLCIQHRSRAFPDPVEDEPIHTIKLIKSDDRPTRIRKENLQIWASDSNYRYRRLDVDFTFSRSSEVAPADVHTLAHGTVTRKGDPVRVLTLSGLVIRHPYILVTTDFTGGEGDFSNASTRMLRAYDRRGVEIRGCFANGKPIYNAAKANFRTWGLMFDTGYGLRTCVLDRPSTSGREGFIAFARGRSPQLGAPCETEPRVQAYWLDRVERMLADGADGIEFRIENHSTHTDFPEEYGYNRAVLDRLADPEKATREDIARVRGDAYTEFLIAARKRIAARGKKMRINFELDFLRPQPPARRLLAYPANVDMQWRRWIELGLLDEAVFRHYGLSFEQILRDPLTAEIAGACRAHSIPIHFNRYVRAGDAGRIMRDVSTIKNDGRFAGYVFYEVCSYVTYKPDGTCSFSVPAVPEAMRYAGEPAGSN